MRSNLCPRPIERPWATFFDCSQYIDVAIPRGGEGLIRRVAEEAKMPVIKHYDGNCHVYVDELGGPGNGRGHHGERQVSANGCLQRM